MEMVSAGRPACRILGWSLSILLLAGCERTPYDALKPHQAIQAGDDAFRRGDLAEAEKIYLLARQKAERAEFDLYTIQREYVGRLAQIYAMQGKLTDVEPLYLKMIENSEQNVPRYRYWLPDGLRAAHNLAVLHYRQGRPAEAERLWTKMGEHWLTHFVQEGLTPPENHWIGDFWRRWVVEKDRDLQLVVLSHLDRLYSAGGRPERAETAFAHLQNLLEVFQRGPRERLQPALADYLLSYAAMLQGIGRTRDADALEDLVRTIQAKDLRPTDPVRPLTPCVIFNGDPPLGCLLVMP
jgi:tetratricopeptide (TPR) repeat protein